MDELAQAAIAPIERGMVVGLGTGRAASRCIRALAERAQSEQLDLTCVATSKAAEQLATELGLKVIDFANVSRVDYLFDGADEVAPDGGMIKGGGGAMTRERLVASAVVQDDDRPTRIYCIDHTKLSPSLGTRFKLPIEILPMARGIVTATLADLGLPTELRKAKDGPGPFITDNSNLILDASLDLAALEEDDEMDVQTLAGVLDSLPGVIDHGLFLDEADLILIETPSGIQRLEP